MRNEEILSNGGEIVEQDGKTIVVFQYKTLEDYIGAAVACPASQIFVTNEDDANFYGTRTFDQGLHMVRHGMDLAHEAVHLSQFAPFSTQTTEIVEDVVGGAVNIGAYLEGIPENMFDFRMVDNPKFIDVVLGVSESAGVNPAQINRKAMGAAWLVDKLESEGYRVRFRALVYSRDIWGKGENINELVLVTIKGHHEPLPIGQISGACSTAFFRRIGFRHRERFFYHRTDTSRPNTLEAIKQVFNLVFQPGDEFIYLPSVTQMDTDKNHPWRGLKTDQDALKWAEHFSNHKITIQ